MRVNGRFEGEAERQVEYLVKSLGVSVSEVLRLSVDSYYRQVRGSTPALRSFAKHVGHYASGTRGTSANYKDEVGDAMHANHTHTKFENLLAR